MKKNVICLGTIWDLDEAIYPEVEDYTAMKFSNLRLIAKHQLSSSSKEISHIVKKPMFPRNQHGIRVRACCASCLFKEVRTDGKRYCSCRHQLVESLNKCRYWQMSEQLEMVGQ